MTEADLPRTQRTPEQPMAFTPDELLRGGLTVWLTFLAVLATLFGMGAIPMLGSDVNLGGVGSYLGMLLFIVVIAGLVSGVVLVFGLLVTRPIALALRRVRSIAVHTVVYALLGAGIGILYLTVITGGHPTNLFTETLASALATGNIVVVLVLSPAIAATVAVPLGWWLTVRRVLRQDAGSSSVARIQP